MLREVRDDGDAPAPPGVAPVNWEMQLSCSGFAMLSEADLKLEFTEANGNVWHKAGRTVEKSGGGAIPRSKVIFDVT